MLQSEKGKIIVNMAIKLISLIFSYLAFIIFFSGAYPFGSNSLAQQVAFPEAEGFGKYTVGGRGGKVIEVTNLNDTGPGSLRAAVNTVGPRTVVFRVSGTISLNSALRISNPFITLAGQTAPGDGICIKKYPLVVETDQVIIRYMRFRLGDESGGEDDAIGGRWQTHIVIDHCSASWSEDETLSFYWCDSTTVQWCIISESLYNSNHPKGNHGYGGIWGGPNATYHHNLIAHHSSRNPRFASGSGETDYRNNVIYNWGGQSVYGAENNDPGDGSPVHYSFINMVANYYKQGPGTKSGSIRYRIVQPSSRNYLADYGQWYVTDNYLNGYPNVTVNNWDGGVQPDDNTQLVKDSIKSDVPAPFIPITQQSAEIAYQLVLENAGAILPRRDAIDTRIINEVSTGTATYGTGTYNQDNGFGNTPTGIIDSQEDVGGWPVLYTGPMPEDSDHDGMPDGWEDSHGLDKNNPEDRNGIGEGGYTNLEVYLNSITEFPLFLHAPSNVTAELTEYTSVELNWEDNTENETGFRIEGALGDTGSFTVAAEVGENVITYTDTGLAELTLYRYRVIAYNDSLESGYERVVEITTLSPTSLPLPVSNPSPGNGAVYVVTTPTLRWKTSINAESYDVYFGTTNPPPLARNQTKVTYQPGELEKGQKYYWRIDGINTNGTTEGLVWSFTVKPEIPSGQIIYWKLDETEGTTVTDDGAYNVNGTLVNMSQSEWTEGIKNGGLSFDGVDDYVLVPHNGIIDYGEESFSISAWLKAGELTGASMYLINKGSFSEDNTAGTTGKWYGLELKNGELRFAIDDNVTKSVATVTNVDTILEGKWTHMVGIRDTSEGTLKVYVNGKMMSSVADVTGNISEEEDMFIGNSTTGTAPLDGVLDEIRIYNYALSEAEVKAIYGEIVDVEGTVKGAPENFVLEQNYPNPFNPSTNLVYSIPYEGFVTLIIYDVLGNEVATVVNKEKPAGEYKTKFNANNLSSGVYFYRLLVTGKAGNYSGTKKMLLLK